MYKDIMNNAITTETPGLNRFMEVYERRLTEAVQKHPEEYFYKVEQVPAVVAKMRAAVVAGSFNKAGYAFRNTCKELGIAYTYTAIKTFISQ
jgi:hypothetical protein